jgi:excisionase family DNA binding protein
VRIYSDTVWDMRVVPVLSAPMPSLRSLDDAAREVGVSRRLLQRWISEGKLQAYRIAGDRRRYVDIDELNRLREPEKLPRPQNQSGDRD